MDRYAYMDKYNKRMDECDHMENYNKPMDKPRQWKR